MDGRTKHIVMLKHYLETYNSDLDAELLFNHHDVYIWQKLETERQGSTEPYVKQLNMTPEHMISYSNFHPAASN